MRFNTLAQMLATKPANGATAQVKDIGSGVWSEYIFRENASSLTPSGSDILASTFKGRESLDRWVRETSQSSGGDAFMPVGTYIQFAGSSAPGGYLACDGTAVSRTTYADLFAVVSTTYGVGDGSTTFNLPDARGLVMVGAGAHGTMTRANGTAYNGGTLGATRNDQLQGHKTRSDFTNIVRRTPDAGNFGGGAGGTGSAIDSTLITDGANGTPRTGDETRPAEIAVLVCIKY